MRTYKVDSRGRITLPKYVREHLGVGPGDSIEFELSSDGKGALMRGASSNKKNSLLGVLAGRTKGAATIDKDNKAWSKGRPDKK